MKLAVQYLAFVVNRDGVHPSPRKVQAIRELQELENLTELKSFLGMVNYYRRFIPDNTSSPFEWFVSRDHSVAMD